MKSEIVSMQSFAEGDIVFQQGDSRTAAYLVREGLVQVGRTGKSGEVQIVGYAGPGQIFGEDALLADGDRSTMAFAKKPSKCVAIDRQKLNATLGKQDPFIAALFNILATNMQSMIDKGADLDCLLQDLSGEDDEVETLRQSVKKATKSASVKKAPADNAPGENAPKASAENPAKAPAVTTEDDDEDDDAFLI